MRSRALEAGELKALVRQLVTAAGGVEAVGVELGISAERVSQFQRPTCPDQMSLLCIMRLEAVVGQAIVTGAAARAVEGDTRPVLATAAVAAVGAAAEALQKVYSMDADGVRDAGEIAETRRAVGDAMRAMQALFDTAAGLTPGRVS